MSNTDDAFHVLEFGEALATKLPGGWGAGATVALGITDFIYHRWFEDVPKPKPVRLQTIPRTDEGATVPLLYGKCRVKAPILASATNITEYTAAEVGSQVAGGAQFIYGADMLFVLGVPFAGDAAVNRLLGMFVGEYRLEWGDFDLAGGGDHPPGGPLKAQIIVASGGKAFPADLGAIGGLAEFLNGKSNQELVGPISGTPSTWAGTRLKITASVPYTRIPGFRGYLSVFLYNELGGFYIGSSATPPAISFEVSSFSDPALIGVISAGHLAEEADPIAVIYDLLIGTFGKLGIPTSYIDNASFLAASTTLLSEQHGYSRSIEDTKDATATIGEILAQIDATLFEDPITNTIKIKLIRQDYVVGLVPNINPSNCEKLEGYSNGGWRNTTNQVRIIWTDRSNGYVEASTTSHSLANASGQDGQVNSVDVQMPGVCTLRLATFLANRELGLRSRPLAKCRAIVDGSFWATNLGDPVTITWPEYNLNQVAFRVANVDRGMPGAEQIGLDLIQDVFGAAIGSFTGPTSTPFPSTVDPLTNRFLSECPRWLAQQAANAAIIANADVPRIFAFAKPDDLAGKFEVRTRPHSLVSSQPYQPDVPVHLIPTHFTLGDGYARTLEPYDTITGLLIQDVVGDLKADLDALGGLAATPAQIATGANLICVARTDGEHEIMAFESSTSLGGGQYLLNNVWRGLLDTPPIDFAGDGTERGWFISTNDLGELGYPWNKVVDAQMVPRLFTAIGSGAEPTDALTIVNRAAMPLPPADVTVNGEVLTGTIGTPGTAAFFKLVSFLEESFEVYGHKRDRLSPTVTRGDVLDETLNDFSTTGYDAYEARQANANVNLSPYLFSTPDPIAVSGSLEAGILVDGYGAITIDTEARRTLLAGDPLIGVGGLQLSQLLLSWRPPAIAAFAPSWRNLLANPRFNYGGGSAGGWNNEILTGSITIGTGAFSLSRAASGPGSHYLQAASPTVVRAQVVLVKRWFPRGMTAIVFGYFRNENSDANDTVTLEVDALQSFAHGLLASGTSVVTPPTANWTYREVAVANIPAGTDLLSAKLSFAEVAGGGTANADSRATELGLCIGQFASGTASLLTNPSFDSGTTASWTVDSGGFVVAATIASPSSNYVQGGAFASSVIHQDFALPVGYEYATAVLRFFRAQTLAGDAGTVTVQALDVANAVLATATTGSEQMPALNIWNKRTLFVDTPDGATKIRVTFTALRSAGAGNSGACLDEANLMLTKKLDATSTTALNFEAATVQKMPATWQAFHLAYPALTGPDYVFGGTDFNGRQMQWSDGATHAAGKLCGQFGAGVTSVAAYSFARASGAGALHIKATDTDAQNVGAYSLAKSFTVLCHFRVDEPGFATVAGLVGRMSTSRGWGISITAAGQLQAILRGAGATSKTIASGRVVTEGGMHTAALVYDAVAHTLSIYDEQGLGASISTAAGLGDFADVVTDTDTYLKIGRDAVDHDTLPGMIGRVFIWGSALLAADIAAQCSYAKDPTGLVTTYTRTAAAIVPMGPDAAGATACVMSAKQFALAYSSVLTLDAGTFDGGISAPKYLGTGLGLAVGKSATNLIPDVNFAGANWIKGASATLTQGIVDPTGRPRGVTVTGDASNGLKVQNVTLAGAPATVPFVFWARLGSGGPTLKVILRTSAGVLVSSTTVTLTALWQRFAVTLGSWAGATVTAQLELISNAGAMVFDLAGIMCATQGTDIPAILPLPAATHGDYNALCTVSLPKQFNYEGEIVAQGVSMIDVPTPAAGTLVQATIGSNVNLRELQVIAGGTGFRSVHYDSAAAHTDATAAYSTYSSRIWKARARWAQCGLLDNVAGPPFSSVAWTDDTHATPTVVAGRVAAWAITATNLTTIKIGAGTAAPSDVVLRSVTLRAREEKLV